MAKSHDVGHRCRSTSLLVMAWMALSLWGDGAGFSIIRTAAAQKLSLPSSITDKEATGEVYRNTAHRGAINDIAISPDGRFLALASSDHTTSILRLSTLKELHRLSADNSGVGGVIFTGDSKRIITVAGRGESEKRNMRIWDVESGFERVRIIGRDLDATSLSISPDGRKMMTTYPTGLADFRRIDSPGHNFPLLAHDRAKTCWGAAFSPDSSVVVTVGGDGMMFVWRVEGQLLRTVSRMKSNQSDLRSVAFSPDGQFIISGDSRGELRRWTNWNVEDRWREVGKYTGHQGAVSCVAFAPNGKFFASGSVDKTIRFYDVATGEVQGVLPGHTKEVTSLAFLPGGQYIVSASLDGTARIWSLRSTTRMKAPKKARKKAPKVAADTPRTRARVKKKANDPVPEKAAYTETVALIEEIFKGDYANAKTPTAKAKLAAKILKQGLEAGISADERYALFQVALKTSIAASDVDGAVEATDRTIAWFDVDANGRLLETLDRLSLTVRRTSHRVQLVRVALELAEESIATDRPDLAEQFVKHAETAARSAGDLDLRRKTRILALQIRKEKAQWDLYRKALSKLKTDDADADANLAVGNYLCFLQGQWAQGLIHLSQGSNMRLKLLAKRDLSNPDDSASQIAVANSWRLLSARAEASHQISYNAAAYYWYNKALPNLKGLQKLKIQLQLKKLGKIPEARRR